MGWFEDFLPDYTMGTAIDAAWNDFRTDFREYWGLDSEYAPEHLTGDQWEEYRKIDGIVHRLSEAAENLIRPDPPPVIVPLPELGNRG